MRVPVGVGIIGRGIHQAQMRSQFGKPGSRTSRDPAEVCVLRLSAITMATRPRCLERATAARACWQKTSAVRPVLERLVHRTSHHASKAGPKP